MSSSFPFGCPSRGTRWMASRPVFFELGLPLLLVLTFAMFMIAMEIGYRIGRQRFERVQDTEKSHASALQAATLGLLALLLGFTFAMAVSRFDDRKMVIMNQANALGTAELRSRFLGSPHAERAAPLFRSLVRAWVEFRTAGADIDAAMAAEKRAGQLEGELWALAGEAMAANPLSQPASLFAASMNDVIDMHESRLRSIEDHVPEAVIYLLLIVSALALGQVAHCAGLGGHRRQYANATFA